MTRFPRLATIVLAVLIACLGAVACAKRDEPGAASSAPAAPAADAKSTDQTVPLKSAARDRKLIRTAELTLKVKSPPHALDEARAIAEQFEGHIVSSTAHAAREPGDDEAGVVVTLKVKAERFDDALRALRRLGRGSGTETIGTEDVTEQVADLDARLRTQEQLEQQYLTILKDAKSVSDALAVHKELAQVRGEIEQLQGKQKLLESQVALSTITVHFEQDEPLVALNGGRFGRALTQAGADVLNVGAAIVIGAIRLAGVLVPVLVLIVLPLGVGFRYLFRRLMASPRAPAHS